MIHLIFVWSIYALPFVAVALFVRWRLRLAKRRASQCCHREEFDKALLRNQIAQARMERRLERVVKEAH